MGVCAAVLARDAPNKSVMQHKDHVHHWWYKTTTKITPCTNASKSQSPQL
jgi:hypothetical protein